MEQIRENPYLQYFLGMHEYQFIKILVIHELYRQQYQDAVDRIEIEGKFGTAKHRYGLHRVMARLAETSESAIATTFLLMNLMKWLRGLIRGS